jgi:hypothetical protein
MKTNDVNMVYHILMILQEDVFITGFAAEICNVPRIHHKGFHNIGANLNKVQKDDVLFHYIDSLAKIDFFNKFAEL